jgi:hypothetical protein
MPQARTRARTKAPQDTTSRFTLQGKGYEIDPSNLEWGEVEELELYFDCPIGDVDFEGMRAIMFIAYLARKRVEPTFSLDDMRKLKMSDLGEDEGPRPTEGSGDANSGTPS